MPMPQAPVVAAAELGVDVLQAVVARRATAAELELDLAGHQIELVVRRRGSRCGSILKKRASAATDLPERFMKRRRLEQPDRADRRC